MSEVVFYLICAVLAFAWLCVKGYYSGDYIEWIREESEKR